MLAALANIEAGEEKAAKPEDQADDEVGGDFWPVKMGNIFFSFYEPRRTLRGIAQQADLDGHTLRTELPGADSRDFLGPRGAARARGLSRVVRQWVCRHGREWIRF